MAPSSSKFSFTTADHDFDIAADLVIRSGAADYLRACQVEDGITCRPDRSVRAAFTLEGILVALYLAVAVGSTVTVTEIIRIIYAMTTRQLAMVGMVIPDADRRTIRDADLLSAEFHRVWMWAKNQLQVLDSSPDLSARQRTNAEYADIVAARDTELLAIIDRKRQRQRTVMNMIVAASIDWSLFEQYRGDLNVDESIIPTANVTSGMGSRPHKRRSAATYAGYYRREDTHELATSESGVAKTTTTVKQGFGVSVTAVSAIGNTRQPDLVPRAILAIDVHDPTPGSGQALVHCLETLDGMDEFPVPGPRQKNRTITTDMGYNGKLNVAEALLARRIDPIHAYPARRGKDRKLTTNSYVFPAVYPADQRRQGSTEPGPILAWGEFYCPAAASILGQNPTVRRRELAKTSGGFARHDRMLAERHPYIMGRLSRPYRSDTKRASRKAGEPADLRWKIDLQGPCIQGRVACPLVQPDAVGPLQPSTVPTARPTWSADQYRSCHSQVTVTLTEQQVKSLQPALTPGSWEHAFALEGRRALTESRFSQMKNRSVTGLSELNYGPRREPFVLLHIAIAVAVSNRSLQMGHKPVHTDVIEKGFKEMDRELGYRAQRRPPLT